MEKMPDEIYAWMGFQDNGSWDREPCVCDSHESVKYIRADLAGLSPQIVPAQHSGAIDELDEQVLARIYALDKLVEQAQELNMGYGTQTAAAPEPPHQTAIEDWQPIESAPKDGTPILTCYSKCYNINGFLPIAVKWGTYHPNAKGNECFRDIRGHKIETITEWMPLPDAPESEG